MSAINIKAKYLKYVATWNHSRDLEEMDRQTDALMAEDAIWHFPGGELQQGTAGQKAFVRDIINNNPDFEFFIDDLLFDEDHMIIRATAKLNNPTTGAIETSGILEIDRIVDEKIVESWSLIGAGHW